MNRRNRSCYHELACPYSRAATLDSGRFSALFRRRAWPLRAPSKAAPRQPAVRARRSFLVGPATSPRTRCRPGLTVERFRRTVIALSAKRPELRERHARRCSVGHQEFRTSHFAHGRLAPRSSRLRPRVSGTRALGQRSTATRERRYRRRLKRLPNPTMLSVQHDMPRYGPRVRR